MRQVTDELAAVVTLVPAELGKPTRSEEIEPLDWVVEKRHCHRKGI